MNDFPIAPHILGFASLFLAFLYFLVWPKPRKDIRRGEIVHFILRWFHSLVWVLLALAFFMWAEWIPRSQIANFPALLALITYLVFLTAFFLDRRASRQLKE